MAGRRFPWKRYLLANWRDIRVLVRQFYAPLLLLGASVLVGGLLFHRLYAVAEIRDLSYAQAVYAIFSMIFMGESLPFPRQWYLQIFYFVMPIVGLALVVQGVISFGVMLFNKSARREEWQVAIASTYKDHVVVAGIGRLGYRIVQELANYGEEVVGIEIKDNGEFVPRILSYHVPVITGDATNPEILKQAGVERASAVIPCTENDLTNLAIALSARELKPDIHVVLRMFDHDMAQKVSRGFNIRTAFSTSALAAPAFARAATRLDVTHAFYVGEMLINVSELSVKPGSLLVGRRVADLEGELDFSMILHSRDGACDLHPNPDIVLQAGDQICVLASLDVLNRLGKMNRTGRL